ncbi:hypothetical protein EOD42_14130 [Rhodovarius crocodyli]|uniref:Phage tail tape measure protein n=1 Tax=Rhodovarius crocodyli TaxID=1979269 RepID=A0A437MF52_9PROT|nr:hypothetical protein [Rhodovarius crocodyli]RVT96246.1 hypothetical protein EOD42_14130 [Rhodovarius crocodyli]
MQDIAALAFAIDSSQAVTATQELDKLTRGAGSTQAAFRQMAETSNDSSKALRDLASQAHLTDSMLRQAGTGLDALINRIQTLSREVGTFRTTTTELTTALGQLRAAGDLFGTTASGIDEFVRASRQIGLNSYETVSSLQRITQALEGTSVAGERARRVLREYGVNVDGRSPDDGAAVLREFVQAMRGRRADGLRNDEVFAVLGPQSISSLAALNNDAYVTSEQRARRAQEGVISPLTLRVRGSISERDATLRNQIAEREDLERNYGDFWEDAVPNWLGGGAERPSVLRQRRASGQTSNGDAFRMEVQPDGTVRWRQGSWGQAFRGAVRNQLGLGSQVRGPDQLNEEMEAYRNSDLYGAAQSDILLRFQQEDEARRDTGWLNRNFNFGAEGRYYWNRFQAYRGQYAPRTDMRRNPDLQRTVNWDLDSDTLIAQGAMTDVQQQLQRMMIPALQGFGNIDVAGMERMSPSAIMDRLRSRDQGWASEALQRRIDALNSNAFQRDGRGYDDRDMTRRVTAGAGSRSDLFGLDPARLGIQGTEVLTDQEAQQKAQLIAQAVLRIRQQYTGLEDQARALQAAADDIDRDQRARTEQRQAQATRNLRFTEDQRSRLIDVNPQNRLSNIYESTRDRVMNDTRDPVLANTEALRALTSAVTDLERATNEALRNSALGVVRATNASNMLLTDAPYVRQLGLSIEQAQAFQADARQRLNIYAPGAPVPGVLPAAGATDALGDSATRYNAMPGRPALGSSYPRRPEDAGPYVWDPERGRMVSNPWHALRGALPPATGRMADFGTQARPSVGPPLPTAPGMLPEINVTAQAIVRPGEADPRGDVRQAAIGGFIDPTQQGLAWLYGRQYGARAMDFSARSQAERLSQNSLEGSFDSFLRDASSSERRGIMQQFDRTLLDAIRAYREQTEALTAATPLERELIQARQRQLREETQLRGAMQGASLEEQRALRARLAVLGIGSAEGGGLYERQAQSRSQFQLRADLTMQQRTLDNREEDAAPWWYTSNNREAYANRSRAVRTAREAGGTEEDILRASNLADRGSEMQRMLRETEQLRQAFVGMGQAGAQALEQLILRGGNAREIFAQLTAQVASTFFRQASSKWGEQLFEYVGGSMFGSGSSGSRAPAGDSSSGSSGSSGLWSFFRSILPFAQGGMTDGTGQVVEHATMFALPSGGRALAGEAGDGDAILPLRRMANGSLGVASSGGGGGGDIYVNVNNHGAGAQTSPEQARMISKEIRRAVAEQQTQQMLEEQRVGGMFNPI